jgi:hypothetical protein
MSSLFPLLFELLWGYKLGVGMKEKNAHAVALGKMGGSKGGKIRAARLSPEERSASARNAALARWAKVKRSKVGKREK